MVSPVIDTTDRPNVGPAKRPTSDSTERTIPTFLKDYTPTTFKKRISPFSRLPALSKMGDIWHVAAQRRPDGRIIVDRPPDIEPDGATVRTYTEWSQLVDKVMVWLHAAGVQPWDRVAVIKTNHLDINLLACAISRLGAIPATLAGSYGPEAAHPLLERLEKPIVITDRAHIDKCGLTREAVASLTLRTISVDGCEGRDDIAALDEFKADGPPVPVQMREFHEPEIITHTSGTTGIPKLVMHSAESVYSMGLIECERWPVIALRKSDKVIFCDPYSHERITTLMLAMSTMTPEVVFISDPEATHVGEILAEYPPTVVEALPNIYLSWEGLTEDPRRLFRNVRLYVNSFDAIHTRTIRKFMAATEHKLPIWIQSWSQSEQGSLVFRPFFRSTVNKVGQRPVPTQLLGWPVPFYSKHRAVDPATGKEVPRGEVGLIEVRQPGRCLAYVGEQFRHDLKVNGEWWNSGDLGIINKWGAVRLVDREIDRIPNGSAIESEDLLLDRLPRLSEVVILPRAGNLPLPVYSTSDGKPISPEEWKEAISDLCELDVPVHIPYEDFPRTGTWKIRRVQLREQLDGEAKAIGIGRWT